MLTKVLLFISFFNQTQQLKVEQLLHKSKLDIQQIMSNSFPEYTTNNFGIKSNDNTLSYNNTKEDATLIFYFNKENRCNQIKLLEDISNLEQKIKEFNAHYKRVSENRWKTIIEKTIVNILIDKEDYNFSIVYQ